jgi:lipoprotein-anchoring transpeptidase ErfK/SrfK
VGDKNTEPMWFRPGRDPVPFGHPENPLGTRWIAWLDEGSKPTGLAFHGTKDPESIGTDQSQGCVRMRNRDVEELFEILPVGARIEVRP